MAPSASNGYTRTPPAAAPERMPLFSSLLLGILLARALAEDRFGVEFVVGLGEGSVPITAAAAAPSRDSWADAELSRIAGLSDSTGVKAVVDAASPFFVKLAVESSSAESESAAAAAAAVVEEEESLRVSVNAAPSTRSA